MQQKTGLNGNGGDQENRTSQHHLEDVANAIPKSATLKVS
jgi:hypothetical protein